MTTTATRAGQGVILAVAKWVCPEWVGPRLRWAWLRYFLHVQRQAGAEGDSLRML